MDWNTCLLLKDPREVKRRRMHGTRNLIKRDTFAHARGEISLCRFSSFSVIGARTFASRLVLDTTTLKCRLQHIRDKLQRRNISPQRLKRIHVCRFESLHQLTMTPENAAVTGTSEEPKRLIGMFVDGWIELANDVVEHTR